MTISSTDDRITAVARAIWNIRREDEDRCDMELEDMPADHSVWNEAKAALRSQGKVVSEEDVAKMQELAESWRVKYYDHLGEPAYLKCAEDLTAIIGEGD